MILNDADNEEILLDAIGPMSEDCDGPIIFPEGTQLNAINAYYTTSGVVSITLEINGNESKPFGAEIEDSTEVIVEQTRWTFDEADRLVGLQAYQTQNVIRELQMITMNVACAESISSQEGQIEEEL